MASAEAAGVRLFGVAAVDSAHSSSLAPDTTLVTYRDVGAVVLLQLTWSSEISTGARELLVERLGLRPHLLVEWKQMLRDAGVVDLQVQDWTDEAADGTGDEAPQLTWQQKLQIVGRAWRRVGWREAMDALGREETLLRELSRERAVGFQLIRGVKWPHARGA